MLDREDREKFYLPKFKLLKMNNLERWGKEPPDYNRLSEHTSSDRTTREEREEFLVRNFKPVFFPAFNGYLRTLTLIFFYILTT